MVGMQRRAELLGPQSVMITARGAALGFDSALLISEAALSPRKPAVAV
jgi:hypothetical protein